jgi:hypothetical protein
MARKQPVTQAIRELRRCKVPFEGFPYEYEEGAAPASSPASSRWMSTP